MDKSRAAGTTEHAQRVRQARTSAQSAVGHHSSFVNLVSSPCLRRSAQIPKTRRSPPSSLFGSTRSSRPARPLEGPALARRRATHRLQRHYLLLLLHHNQVSGGVVGVSACQELVAKPDGSACRRQGPAAGSAQTAVSYFLAVSVGVDTGASLAQRPAAGRLYLEPPGRSRRLAAR